MSDDTGVMKWMAIMIGCIFICVAFHLSVRDYYKSVETKAAMEQGYEQILEDGKVLWKKRL